MGVHSHMPSRDADRRVLKVALALIGAFMAAEVTAGVLADSLALLSDAAHMLTDAAALAVALLAARLASRPTGGSMTYGLGRAEILSAQANGATLLVLGALIIFGAIGRLINPPHPDGLVMIIVASVGVGVNLIVVRVLGRSPAGQGHSPDGHAHGVPRSLNVEGPYRHILTDLYASSARSWPAP
jgi:cobalt-zinc-cadmium efflux system protein